MAFNPRQIAPIDFNKSAAVGIDLPISAPGVFKSNFTTAAAIKNNLINYFLTNPGERPLNPTFGGGLRTFIFEQIVDDNLDFLKETLQSNLEDLFPNITVKELEVKGQEDTQIVTISLSYSVVNTGINDTLEIDFT